MKMILFASALALGSAAFAQDSTMQPAPAPAAAPADPSMAAPAAAPAPAADPSMSGGNMSGAAASASSTDDSSLPMCSKTVTDKCKQGGGHGKMHHKKM